MGSERLFMLLILIEIDKENEEGVKNKGVEEKEKEEKEKEQDKMEK